MKRIGFSKKYFTLWKITESDETADVEGVFLPYRKKDEQFIKNLSFDEKTAKRKAIFENVENFEIDFKLCSPKYWKEQKSLDELFFDYCEHRKESVKQILLENGFGEVNGQIVFPEHFKKIKHQKSVIKKISKQDEIEVLILSNINSENEFRFSFQKEVFVGIWEGETKGFIYQGFEYFFPIIEGGSRRFKNKKAKLKVSDFEAGIYKIKQIKIL